MRCCFSHNYWHVVLIFEVNRLGSDFEISKRHKREPTAKRADLLMVIKTQGLEYDDRLRKEAGAFADKVDMRIACVEREANCNRRGKVYGGIDVTTHEVLSRRVFKPGKGVFLKALEVNFWLLGDIVRFRPRIVWIHDPDMIVLVVLSLVLRSMRIVDKVVWDQHELPNYVHNKIGRWLLKSALSRIDALIVTNSQRRDYLLTELEVNPKETYIVENYSDRSMIEQSVEGLPDNASKWLAGDAYVLAQGGGRPDRYHSQLVSACESVGIKVIVIGNVAGEKIASKYVYYTGQIPQSDIVAYIDHCLASVVLYESNSLNTKYCSPNRLFQALGRKKPVLVGRNPPMVEVIQETGAGVVLDTDGCDVKDLVNGLSLLLNDLHKFSELAATAHQKFVWEDQEETLLRIVAS